MAPALEEAPAAPAAPALTSCPAAVFWILPALTVAQVSGVQPLSPSSWTQKQTQMSPAAAHPQLTHGRCLYLIKMEEVKRVMTRSEGAQHPDDLMTLFSTLPGIKMEEVGRV